MSGQGTSQAGLRSAEFIPRPGGALSPSGGEGRGEGAGAGAVRRSADLRTQLRERLTGRVCLLGMGNDGLGDDGFGLRLAEALQASGQAHAHAVGATPERWLARNGLEAVDHLVFVDAVDFGGAPGAVVFLDAGQMAARFPQVSTHKLSLGLLAKWAEANGRTTAWLLGVQPASLRPGAGLSPAVQLTLELLKELLCESLGTQGPTEPARQPRSPSPWPSPPLGERETRRLRVRPSDARWLVAARDAVLPLPEGEGWGEGESAVRRCCPQPSTLSPQPSTLPAC